MKQSRLIIIIIVLTTFLIGCNSQKDAKEIDTILSPDKIFIFQNGTKTELPKDSPLFDKVVQLTNERLDDSLTIIKDIVDQGVVDNYKKDTLGIEFIYDKEQSLTKGYVALNFNKLYFPLVSSKYGERQGSIIYTMQYGDKLYYKDSSRGELKSSSAIVKTLKKYNFAEEKLNNKSSEQTSKVSSKKNNKFIYMNDIVKKLPLDIGSEIKSLELKTFEMYQREVNDTAKFYEINNNTMVWVAKVSYPYGLQTKVGYYGSATRTYAYDALTGRGITSSTTGQLIFRTNRPWDIKK